MMIIWNPGMLPEGWTVKNLLAAHASAPFNPAVANVFFRSGEIETWGRGIERIVAAGKAAGAPSPALAFDGTGLTIEFRYAPAYLKAIAAPETSSTGGVTDPVTPEVTPGVTPEVGRMLAIMAGEMGRVEIMAALGLQDEKHFREHYQQTAVAAGLIERTIPNKPNSRLQKYRLTAQGRGWLARHLTKAMKAAFANASTPVATAPTAHSSVRNSRRNPSSRFSSRGALLPMAAESSSSKGDNFDLVTWLVIQENSA